mgnify:CR=1 FL=1
MDKVMKFFITLTLVIAGGALFKLASPLLAEFITVEFFKMLRETGFDTCLISNNKQKRVTPFAKNVGSKAVWKANKPFRKNYLYACRLMNTTPENTIFVGDQLFTDVWGANISGIKSVLVKPIDKKEEIQIVLKRYLERPIMYFYNRKKDRADKLF